MRTLLLIAALLLAAPAVPAQERETLAPDGSHAVVTAPEFILQDAARGSALPVIAVHPKLDAGGTERFPLIIFSHGLGGRGSQVLTLPRYWASHGYIVLVPTHRDSVRHATGKGREWGGLRTMLKRVRAEKADFLYRPADVRFLIDALDTVVARVPALRDRIDRERIGAGGHSLGAYTTALIGGARIDLPDGTDRATVGDGRVRALLMLSPQGTGKLGLTELSWDDIRRPMMSVTGSKDGGAGGQTPEWRKEPYLRAPSGDKYHLFIQGADHGFFTKPPGAKAARRFGKEQERAGRRRSPDPAPKKSVLGRLLGDPAQRIAEQSDAARAKLIKRLERVVEQGRGGKKTQGDLLGKLQHLLVVLRDGEWATADTLRDELLRGSTTTSGETVEPLVKFELVQLTTRLFWDAHLKGDSGAAARLAAGSTLDPADGTVTLDHK